MEGLTCATSKPLVYGEYRRGRRCVVFLQEFFEFPLFNTEFVKKTQEVHFSISEVWFVSGSHTLILSLRRNIVRWNRLYHEGGGP